MTASILSPWKFGSTIYPALLDLGRPAKRPASSHPSRSRRPTICLTFLLSPCPSRRMAIIYQPMPLAFLSKLRSGIFLALSYASRLKLFRVEGLLAFLPDFYQIHADCQIIPKVVWLL
jgi:hypothetical protein